MDGQQSNMPLNFCEILIESPVIGEMVLQTIIQELVAKRITSCIEKDFQRIAADKEIGIEPFTGRDQQTKRTAITDHAQPGEGHAPPASAEIRDRDP